MGAGLAGMEKLKNEALNYALWRANYIKILTWHSVSMPIDDAPLAEKFFASQPTT